MIYPPGCEPHSAWDVWVHAKMVVTIVPNWECSSHVEVSQCTLELLVDQWTHNRSCENKILFVHSGGIVNKPLVLQQIFGFLDQLSWLNGEGHVSYQFLQNREQQRPLNTLYGQHGTLCTQYTMYGGLPWMGKPTSQHGAVRTQKMEPNLFN